MRSKLDLFGVTESSNIEQVSYYGRNSENNQQYSNDLLFEREARKQRNFSPASLSEAGKIGEEGP